MTLRDDGRLYDSRRVRPSEGLFKTINESEVERLPFCAFFLKLNINNNKYVMRRDRWAEI